MGYSIDTVELPCGIEAVAKGADEAVRRDKTPPVQIMASGDGHPSVTFYKRDGSVEMATLIDGAWHSYKVVS